jgi:hypothetical protein
MAYTQRIAAEHDILILDPSTWKSKKRRERRGAPDHRSRDRRGVVVHAREDRDGIEPPAAP